MSLKRIKYEDRESWLLGRQRGIGGSEAAAAVGLSPWQSPLDLWRLKTGQSAPKDLSGNPNVERGVQMEPILRRLYSELHPEYEIVYNPFDILFQDERPWLFATLDGELPLADAGSEQYFDEQTGTWKYRYPRNSKRGILEIKTGSPSGKDGWEKWSNGNMPQHYYIQCCHQLLATGFDFVRLFACLYSQNGDMTLKQYEIEREDVKEDLEWLAEQEPAFWDKVQRGIMPAVPLML